MSAIALAGIAAGAAWAAIVAFLRDRFNANEILVSLMLVYVAEMLLGYLVYGPWKDPEGYNFPQTITFLPVTQVPLRRRGAPGARRAVRGAAGGASAPGCFSSAPTPAFSWRSAVRRRAPRATPGSRRAARSGRRCSVSGGLAGLAGALEVAGPLGQLTPHLPVGYGFTGIIVAFVGRLHPFGILLSSILMSMLYIGGELAQSRLGLPQALSGVFQGLLLFTLLACDALASYRVPARRAPHRQGGRKDGGGGVMGGLALMLAASVNAGTVLALAGLGLLVNERAGVLNLGAEGMMLIGALAGYATALHCRAGGCSWRTSPRPARGRRMAALFGWLAIGIGTNQYATGLALSLFGVGFSAFAGASASSTSSSPARPRRDPLAARPAVGRPGAVRLPPAGLPRGGCWPLGLGWFFFRSRAGLLLRAVGESPESAHALGHRVRALRLGGGDLRRRACAAWRAPTSRSPTRTCGSRT